MSWLSEVFSSGDSAPVNISALEADARQRQAAYAAEQAALQGQQVAQQTATAVASNPTPPPAAYSGPTAEAKLQALLPSGFENTLIPSTVDDPYIESSLGQGRSKAQAFIENMLKRGTLTGTGRTKGLSAISAQDAGVRSKLGGISEALLQGGRANLRGTANQGFSAASGQSGENFDPSPWYNRANTEASQFLSAFPQSYTTAVGDIGALYDTSGLGIASGGVTSPENIAYDPYAVEGGKLSTGLEESGTPPAQKKRSTAVF